MWWVKEHQGGANARLRSGGTQWWRAVGLKVVK